MRKEELFGPILPVHGLRPLDERSPSSAPAAAAGAVLLRPRAAASRSACCGRTHAGGVTINDWGWHVFQHDLPFGGSGNSGMGTYHGEEGFRELSHAKAVFKRQRWFPIGLFYPPYGNLVQRLSMWFYLGKAPGVTR